MARKGRKKGRKKGEVLHARKQSGSFFRHQPRHRQGPNTGNEETDGTTDGLIENLGPSTTEATGHADKPTMATTNERTPTSSAPTSRERPGELETTKQRRRLDDPKSAAGKSKQQVCFNPTIEPVRRAGKTRKSTTKGKITIGCWNIRKGLLRREQEMTEMINNEEINIMFLVETDTNAINKEEDYKIEGFKTVLPLKSGEDKHTRILGLVDETRVEYLKVRKDLMDNDFPSIWLEMKRDTKKNLLVCGFYREWTKDGDNSQERQIQSIKVLTNQIEVASKENKQIIITGDANLCSRVWRNEEYKYKRISEELLDTLNQCGLKEIQLGNTYMADRLSKEGQTISSALDHVYLSTTLAQNTRVQKLSNSSTDHVPVKIEVITEEKVKPVKKKITKRSMKNFSITKWNECLAKQEWEKLGETEDVNAMVGHFTEAINKALDECAPIKTFTLKQGHKQGLTEEVKRLMKDRDETRKRIHKASPNEKKILHEKYKRLRNKTTTQMRNDKIRMNGERIESAKDEKETWKIINEITNPQEKSAWKLVEDGVEVDDEQQIADKMNEFFVEKVAGLKKNIDKTMVKDPLEKIKKKLRERNLQFRLKSVTEKTVKKAMDGMKKKKSSGKDGVSQECLLMGKDVLKIPLTRIINNSIETGRFPDEWKEAIVAPILKKGDPTDKRNYRPISCLVTASKVMEKVVCDQFTRFLETHNLLPENQHGFRQKRSTMTALTSMQKEWVHNTEEGLITGILVWDLSAAYDTINTDLLCAKLKLYGCDLNTCRWFESFLTGRTQRVRIGQALSNPLNLESGLPQGGILSPIIFTLYGADLEDWLKNSKAFNYADDTSTSSKANTMEEMKEKLEVDAVEVLRFMASNGLVANPQKTVFMILNNKSGERQTIEVGNDKIEESEHTKLLGMEIQENQKWSVHFKKLKNALNHRLFQIRRIRNQLPKEQIMKVVHSLWMSKLRYGLQLCAQTRTSEEEVRSTDMKIIQITQNRLLRMLTGTTLRERKSTKEMLKTLGLPSVNQLAIEVKLTETWKSVWDPIYPVRLDGNRKEGGENNRILRPESTRQLKDYARTKIGENSFCISAAKLWNKTPLEIREAPTLNQAKKMIREYSRTMPI